MSGIVNLETTTHLNHTGIFPACQSCVEMPNKTANHNRLIFYIFHLPTLLKMCFRRIKVFLFRKTLSSPNFDDFFPIKPLIWQKKKDILRNMFHTHSTANLQPFTDFDRKSPHFVQIWEILLFILHSKANLLQFGDKKINFGIVQFSVNLFLLRKRP